MGGRRRPRFGVGRDDPVAVVEPRAAAWDIGGVLGRKDGTIRRAMILWCAVLALVIGAVALRVTAVDAAPGGGKSAVTTVMEIDDDCIVTDCGDGDTGDVGDDCAGDCGDVGDDCAGNCGDVGDDAAGDVWGDVGDDCAGDCHGDVGDDCAGHCPNGSGDDCAGDCGGHDKCPCPSAKPSAAPSTAPSAKPSDDGNGDDDGDDDGDKDGDSAGGTSVSSLPDTGAGTTGVLESTGTAGWLLLTVGLLTLAGLGFAVRRRGA